MYNDPEIKKLVDGLCAYADHLKSHPEERHRLLVEAGIVDEQGNLTKEYQSNERKQTT